jgi:cytochrome c
MLVICLLWMLTGSSAEAGEITAGPRLGQPADRALIDAWQLNVFPDGIGLPPGRGTVTAGKIIYEQYCASCHGPDGSGSSGDQLAGAVTRLTDEYPEKTIGTYWPYATTLFDFIRRSKPMQSPGSLTSDEIYALTAYLLYLNGILDDNAVLDAHTLPEVRMPNRDGFIDVWETEERDQGSRVRAQD